MLEEIIGREPVPDIGLTLVRTALSNVYGLNNITFLYVFDERTL